MQTIIKLKYCNAAFFADNTNGLSTNSLMATNRKALRQISPFDLLRMAEVPRAGVEFASLVAWAPWLNLAPAGQSHPVVVIPGFLASDESTRVLRTYLTQLGYHVHPWAQGRNLGAAKLGGYEPLVNHVLSIYRETGHPVSIVGWSLGGVHALAVAERAAYAVRQVITLGSPIVYSDKSDSVFTALRAQAAKIGGVPISTPQNNPLGWRDNFERLPTALPITSIYSRTDAVVGWRRSHLRRPGKTRDNIEVHSSHLGLGVNPAVLYAVADRLAAHPETFSPFHRTGWRTLVYPAPPRRIYD